MVRVQVIWQWPLHQLGVAVLTGPAEQAPELLAQLLRERPDRPDHHGTCRAVDSYRTRTEPTEMTGRER